MTIPRKRRGSFGSYDIEDQEAIEERKERRVLAHTLAFRHRIRQLDSRSRDQQYSDLRSKGISGLRAFVAAYDKMPAKKKPQGIGAKYRAAKKARNYGATASFNKALVAAVKKVENKSHETMYSNFGITWNSAIAQSSGGFQVGGFQATAGASASSPANVFGSPNQIHLISIPAQCQTGNGGQNGYRRGQHVQPLGIQFWFRGWLQNMTNSHDFHIVLARWKSTTTSIVSGNTAGSLPLVSTHAGLSLFEQGVFGPNSSGFLASNSAIAECNSASRFNRDAWDVKMHKRWTTPAPAQRECSNMNVYRQSVKCDGYYKFKENDWDYITNTGTSIKGGDYFMLFWQESQEPSSNVAPAAMLLQCNMELSFKDA